MKNASSITIAFVGPYAIFKGLSYNKSLVVGGYDQLNLSQFNDQSKALFYWYWHQVGAQINIDRINRDPNILPNTSISIKRFNNFPLKSRKKGSIVSNAMMTAYEIATEHPDVVAVFGELWSDTTIYSAEIFSQFQLPLCGSAQTAPKLLDKAKFPYYIQTLPLSPVPKLFSLALRSWNVKRLAVIIPDSGDDSDICGSVIVEIEREKIAILTTIRSSGDSTDVAQKLEKVDARYIFICMSPDATADIYFGLANKKLFVGPQYVWLSINYPYPTGNATEKYGANYAENAKGFISLWSEDEPTENQDAQWEYLIKAVDRNHTLEEAVRDAVFYTTNTKDSYDCTGLLAYGIHKRIGSNAHFSREDLSNMSYSVFQDTGYRGITSDPFYLTDNGDSSRVMSLVYLDETMNVTAFGRGTISASEFVLIPGKHPIFYDGSSVPPSDGPVFLPKTMKMAAMDGICLIALVVIGIMVAIVFAISMLYFRKKSVVRSASPIFLSLMAAGTMISYATIFLYFGVPSVSKCKIRIWLQNSAYILIIGSILLKNARIWMIYNSADKLSSKILSDKTWLLPLGLMLLLQQGLLAFWFRVSPITVTKELFIVEKSIHYSCEFSSRTGGFARYIIWTYAFLWIVMMLILAAKSQKIGPSHSELCLLCSFPFICILSVGFMIVSRNSVNAEYQQAIIIWAATSFPLILQSFPKALDLYQSEFSQNWRQILTTSQNSKIVPSSPKSSRKSLMPSNKTSNSSNNLVRFVPIPIPTQCYAAMYLIQSQLSWFPKWRQCSVHVAKSKTKEFVLFTSRLDNTSSFAEVLALERMNVQVIQNLSFVRVNISTSNRRVMIDFVNEAQGKEFAEQVASLFMA